MNPRRYAEMQLRRETVRAMKRDMDKDDTLGAFLLVTTCALGVVLIGLLAAQELER